MFRNFPYSNMSDLNIDWILDVIKHAEHMMHHLNDIIAAYISNMTSTLQTEILSGKQESINYARQMEYQYEGKLDDLKQFVNRNSIELQNKMLNLENTVDSKNKKLYNDIMYQVQIYYNNVNNEMNRLTNQLRYTQDSLIADMQALKEWVENTTQATQDMLMNIWKNFLDSYATDQSNIHSDIAQVYVDIGKEISDMNEAIANWSKLNGFQLQVLQDAIEKQIDEKADKIYVIQALEKLEEQIKNIDVNTSTVINPVNKQETDINTALQDVYNACQKVWALKAWEYDNLKITAGQYDKYHVTAWEYDNLARWFLWYKPRLIKHFHRDLKRLKEEMLEKIESINDGIEKKFEEIEQKIKDCKEHIDTIAKELEYSTHMYSPVSGQYVTVTNAILELSNEIRKVNGITAGVYDSKAITASTYDAKRITAHDYDWNGKQILGGI